MKGHICTTHYIEEIESRSRGATVQKTGALYRDYAKGKK